MAYNFDELIDRKGTYAAKIDALPVGSLPDALAAWVADMDFACAQPILQALHRRVDKQIFGYSLYDNDDLKNAVSGWFMRRHGWTVSADDIFFSPGVLAALAFLIHMLTEEGDGVIIQRPVYYPFTSKIEGGRRRIYNSPLLYQNGQYTMDFDSLEQQFADTCVKGMILCNPHNPVGRVWQPVELLKVVSIAKKHQKWIIADEIHMDLTRKGVVHTPLMTLAPDYADFIISCTAPSKTFNMAGMQLSNIVICNKEWQARWQAVVDTEFSVGVPNPLSIEATIAAYNEGEEWLEELRDYLDKNIRYVEVFMREQLPKAHVLPIEGTYLVWVDLNAYESDPKKLEQLMKKTAKVALDEGYIFGEEGNGFERINIAMPKSQVAECLRRMKEAIDAMPTKIMGN